MRRPPSPLATTIRTATAAATPRRIPLHRPLLLHRPSHSRPRHLRFIPHHPRRRPRPITSLAIPTLRPPQTLRRPIPTPTIPTAARRPTTPHAPIKRVAAGSTRATIAAAGDASGAAVEVAMVATDVVTVVAEDRRAMDSNSATDSHERLASRVSNANS